MRRGRKTSEPIDNSDNTVAHMRDIEIQQVTQLETSQFEIAEKLAAMYGKNCLDRLQLDHDPISNEKIDSIAVIDSEILVSNRNKHLPARRQALLFQLVISQVSLAFSSNPGPTTEWTLIAAPIIV